LENQQKSFIKRKIVSWVEKITYKTADRIILTSKRDKDFVVGRFKINSEKIKIIPNYIDTELFRPFSLEKEKNRIIFVGRLEAQKNLFNLIKALSGIPVKLVLIGRGFLKEKLEELAKEKKVDVKFINKIANKDLPQEYNKSKLFILPSFYEGCPKALLEAMSCGLPCIGSNVEGIKEIITHKENGYLCKTDSESIRKAIIEVLNNKGLQNRIGENARKTILENFSFENIVLRESKLYEVL
jgi:glycosyltransferase involved in cell wall biosynthesis